MFSILLSWLGLLIICPAFNQPSSFEHMKSTINSIAMNPAPFCETDTIQASLRTWIDITPRSRSGALPPESIGSWIPQSSSHSHVLNIELQLHNSSEQTQQVHIKKASWKQGNHEKTFRWAHQPDMSPLNRFNTVQSLPLNLHPTQSVNVTLTLYLNGKSCSLTATSEQN